MEPDHHYIKRICSEQGAGLTGITSAGRLSGAPSGYRPQDLLPSCRSVIILASRFPDEAVGMDTVSYTFIRNEMVKKMDEQAKTVSGIIKKMGFRARLINSIGGSWDNGRFMGHISLKHAAELAGLGRIGKNYLLMNRQHGNLLWLSGVLTSLELESDPVSADTICNDCNLCIDNCPASALSGTLFDQKACYNCCYKMNKGKLELKCWKCRTVCPFCFGA